MKEKLMDEPLIVLTTLPAAYDGRELGRALVEARVAACVNIVVAVRSVYRWKDGVEAEDEQLLIIKSSRGRLSELQETLRRLHPYETPEFVVLRVDELSEDYRAWLFSSISR